MILFTAMELDRQGCDLLVLVTGCVQGDLILSQGNLVDTADIKAPVLRPVLCAASEQILRLLIIRAEDFHKLFQLDCLTGFLSLGLVCFRTGF